MLFHLISMSCPPPPPPPSVFSPSVVGSETHGLPALTNKSQMTKSHRLSVIQLRMWQAGTSHRRLRQSGGENHGQSIRIGSIPSFVFITVMQSQNEEVKVRRRPCWKLSTRRSRGGEEETVQTSASFQSVKVKLGNTDNLWSSLA